MVKTIFIMLNRFFAFLFLVFVFSFSSGFSQTGISICSWNFKDFGKSKNASEIDFIANTIKGFDVIAIQEVVAGYGGAQAVARLHAALNRNESNWDYVVSNPTSSANDYKVERYACIWKTSRLKKVGDAWLDQQ